MDLFQYVLFLCHKNDGILFIANSYFYYLVLSTSLMLKISNQTQCLWKCYRFVNLRAGGYLIKCHFYISHLLMCFIQIVFKLKNY